MFPERKTPRLRWGRVSVPGSRYFITACTKDRVCAFREHQVASAVKTAILELHAAGDADIFAATIMPDHVHMIIQLGSTISLGQVVGKMKSRSRRLGGYNWHWQTDGFERRLRDDDSVEEFAFYIFMNPYRGNLISLSERWGWWICPEPGRVRFLSAIQADEAVPEEWVDRSRRVGRHIKPGPKTPL